jgi:CDP-glucose 4,6-dehydratase
MKNPLGQRLRELPGPVLLTGHTGFKGTWMTFLLEHLDIPVVGYSLHPAKDSLFDRAEREGFIPEAFADIRDCEALEKFIDLHHPSAIIHMAAQPLVLKSYENPRETFDVNVMGSVNLFDIAFKKDFIKSIIVVTTDKVYRNDDSGRAFIETDPLEGKDPYSASKVGTEAVVAAWQQIAKLSDGPKVVSVRAGNVIGGGDFAESRLIPDLVRSYSTGIPFKVRNPESTRPWQFVLEPLVGYLLFLEKMLSGNCEDVTLNFGPIESPIRVKQVIKFITEMLETIHVEPLQRIAKLDSAESKKLSLNPSRALEALSWGPKLSQLDSVEWTIDWWKQYFLHPEPENVRNLCKQQTENYYNLLY